MTAAAMEPLTVEKTLELLDRAVEERGADFVYDEKFDPRRGYDHSCYYRLPDGRPGCIVGRVLTYLDPAWVFTEGLGPISQHIRIDELAVLTVLEAAQASQDRGASWGLAVQRAKEVIA